MVVQAQRYMPLLLLSALLSACSPQPLRQPEVVRPDPEPVEAPVTTTPTQPVVVEQPSGRPDDSGSSGAVDQLLVAARADLRGGDVQGAVARLERALRIAPSNADVYLELAELYLQRGDTELARNMAGRGLMYCSSSSQCRALERLAD